VSRESGNGYAFVVIGTHGRNKPGLDPLGKKMAALRITCDRLLPESLWFSISSATRIVWFGISIPPTGYRLPSAPCSTQVNYI